MSLSPEWQAYAAMVAPPELAGCRCHRLLVITDYSDIWLAEETALGRPVAIKAFAPKPGADGMVGPFRVPEWHRRFLVEARVMAGFDHPNILPVHRLARLADGRPAMVQQYMAGSLRLEIGYDHALPEIPQSAWPRAVTPERARQILLDLLAALIAVHGRGLVHRDVKPLNLLLAHGPGSRVKLADFGMVRRPDEPVANEPIWFGSRDYIAPEQMENATRAEAAADIFAVGMLAYRLVAGRLAAGAFAAPASMAAAPGLAALVAECLNPDPARRPSAVALRERLLMLE